MGERKVVNKYYPPDFDPSKLSRVRRRPKNNQMDVRMMLPMSIRCNTCGNYIYKGTKFNSRKENVIGEAYLGKIQILRFYFKCTSCCSELTIKTDPQNSDYIVESGATRNFEPWCAEEAEERRREEAEEMGDPLKSLKNRTLQSKREMDIVAALYELKSIKSRHATVSADAMLEAALHPTPSLLTRKENIIKLEEEEDEAVITSIVFHHNSKLDAPRRIIDDFLQTKKKKRKTSEEATNSSTNGLRVCVVKRMRLVAEKNVIAEAGLQSLFQNYAKLCKQ